MYEMPKRGPDIVFTCEFSGIPPQGSFEVWARAKVETAIKAAKIVCFIMIFWFDDAAKMRQKNKPTDIVGFMTTPTTG